jgi:RNA polymerase sigma-70 factor, ECF subfamily
VNNNLDIEEKCSVFNSEVTPHLKSLMNYAYKMTNNFDDSEDLVQETLLKAFRFFDYYELDSNIKAWLFKIMYNSFVNNYRTKVKQPHKVDYGDVLSFYNNIKSEEVKIRHFQPDALNNGFDDNIIDALAALPDDFRTIIFLCDIEGYSYKEISPFLDCPIGTIRSRLHRTRKILYALLYNYASENGYVNSFTKRDVTSSIKKVIKTKTTNRIYSNMEIQ